MPPHLCEASIMLSYSSDQLDKSTILVRVQRSSSLRIYDVVTLGWVRRCQLDRMPLFFNNLVNFLQTHDILSKRMD